MVGQAFSYISGKYCVEFPEGTKSLCMPKGVAKSYAEMFGGTVVRHPEFPTILDRLRALLSDSETGQNPNE